MSARIIFPAHDKKEDAHEKTAYPKQHEDSQQELGQQALLAKEAENRQRRCCDTQYEMGGVSYQLRAINNKPNPIGSGHCPF